MRDHLCARRHGAHKFRPLAQRARLGDRGPGRRACRVCPPPQGLPARGAEDVPCEGSLLAANARAGPRVAQAPLGAGPACQGARDREPVWHPRRPGRRGGERQRRGPVPPQVPHARRCEPGPRPGPAGWPKALLRRGQAGGGAGGRGGGRQWQGAVRARRSGHTRPPPELALRRSESRHGHGRVARAWRRPPQALGAAAEAAAAREAAATAGESPRAAGGGRCQHWRTGGGGGRCSSGSRAGACWAFGGSPARGAPAC
mmetsp:Transcript_61925/g.199690  ORF Transcript_61925/g.199690 Transcript_61925/m.199690 type:complete len:258 (-) Transcript_61925:3-776(-)